jgi:hypothetical protein
MDWEYDIFQLIIQPDPNKNLSNFGNTVIKLSLNENLTAGILLMSENIFGPTHQNHLTLQLFSSHRVLIPFYPEYYYSRYKIVAANIILPVNNNELWYNYIDRLSSNKKNIIRAPASIDKRYTCRFLNSNKGTSRIYQFDNTDFLQGAISLCTWLELNWMEYINNLHMGNIPYEISNN